MKRKSIYKSRQGKSEILSFYESFLKNWPKPNKKKIISTKYGDTFVFCSGKATSQPIVLIHGSSSNSAMWIAEVTELSKNYRVYAIDIIGECGNSSENRHDWKANNYSDWLFEIFNKLCIDRAILIGCSLGSWITIDFSVKHSERTNKLILLTTAGITQVKLTTIFWLIIPSIFGRWGFNKMNKMVYGNLNIDKKVLEFAALIKKYYKPRTDVLPLFTDDQLQQINIPVYFMGGDSDCFYNSAKTAKRLSENIKKVKTQILQNTGHVIENAAEKILNFIENEEI